MRALFEDSYLDSRKSPEPNGIRIFDTTFFHGKSVRGKEIGGKEIGGNGIRGKI